MTLLEQYQSIEERHECQRIAKKHFALACQNELKFMLIDTKKKYIWCTSLGNRYKELEAVVALGRKDGLI